MRPRFPVRSAVHRVPAPHDGPGGAIIIPLYITMKRLGLIDSLWSVTLAGVGSTFAIFLMRNYFTSIPRSLEESAHMDGASQFRILGRIYLRSRRGAGTITLMEMVGKWNHFFSAVLYLHSVNSRRCSAPSRAHLAQRIPAHDRRNHLEQHPCSRHRVA